MLDIYDKLTEDENGSVTGREVVLQSENKDYEPSMTCFDTLKKYQTE